MKFPSVYPLTIPSSQRTMRMIAIVSSMDRLLDAPGASICLLGRRLSNGCAASGAHRWAPHCRALVLCFLAIVACSRAAGAQATAPPHPDPPSSKRKQTASFLAGAAIAFGAHESGHLG